MRVKTANMAVRVLVVLFAAGAVGFLVLLVALLILKSLLVPKHSRDLRDYPHLLAQWARRAPELVAHFPQSIPESASLKKLSYFPGFMQGGAHIQLRVRLARSEIDELHAKFTRKKTKSFFGGNTNHHMNEKDGMPTTFFRTGERNESSFPADFEIMIFDIFDKVIPESERPKGHYWNHGDSHGVAISRKRSEIVYWAEQW